MTSGGGGGEQTADGRSGAARRGDSSERKCRSRLGIVDERRERVNNRRGGRALAEAHKLALAFAEPATIEVRATCRIIAAVASHLMYADFLFIGVSSSSSPAAPSDSSPDAARLPNLQVDACEPPNAAACLPHIRAFAFDWRIFNCKRRSLTRLPVADLHSSQPSMSGNRSQAKETLFAGCGWRRRAATHRRGRRARERQAR